MGGFIPAPGQAIYDLAFAAAGKPMAGAELPPFVCVRDTDFPIDLAESRAVAKVAATASAVFSLQKNGVQFGTITFGAGSAVGVFAAAAGASLVAGDLLTIVAPAVADATLAQLGFNLVAEV